MKQKSSVPAIVFIAIMMVLIMILIGASLSPEPQGGHITGRALTMLVSICVPVVLIVLTIVVLSNVGKNKIEREIKQIEQQTRHQKLMGRQNPFKK